MKCPNKNIQDWKNLVRKVGEKEAYNIYVENGDEIPEVDIDSDKLSSPKSNDINDNIKSFIHVLEKRVSRMYDDIKNEKDYSKKQSIKDRITKIEDRLEL